MISNDCGAVGDSFQLLWNTFLDQNPGSEGNQLFLNRKKPTNQILNRLNFKQLNFLHYKSLSEIVKHYFNAKTHDLHLMQRQGQFKEENQEYTDQNPTRTKTKQAMLYAW